MQTSSKITRTEGTDITISITATVREWRAMMKQLADAHPSWVLASEIRDAIGRVERESLGPVLEVPDANG